MGFFKSRSEAVRAVSAYPPPLEDEEALNLVVDWTKEEESKAKRKSVPPIGNRLPPHLAELSY